MFNALVFSETSMFRLKSSERVISHNIMCGKVSGFHLGVEVVECWICLTLVSLSYQSQIHEHSNVFRGFLGD